MFCWCLGSAVGSENCSVDFKIGIQITVLLVSMAGQWLEHCTAKPPGYRFESGLHPCLWDVSPSAMCPRCDQCRG